ncbi:MAG: radical SAM protein [Deltaproteobacteria bacterium]|nr:radical SAM protein [Deltaproteobacteria bacterium]
MARLQALGIAYIGITGGEPLLRKDVGEIIRSVDDRSIVILSTNGKALSRKRALALKQAGLFSLAVSLDSADPDTHNRSRGDRDAFESALEAIRISAQAGLYTMVHAVVLKKELSREHLFKLFKLVKREGAHEVRIHEPVPCGGVLHAGNGDGVFYSEQDHRRLFRIQFAANRKLTRFPKVSSLPYTEHPTKFGCCAGVLHSYITSSGDFCPCDFVPVSFGNVLKENVTDLYDRMNHAMGVPRKGCWGIRIAPSLRGKELPLDPSETLGLCRSEATREYPRFFKDLQTSRNGEHKLPHVKEERQELEYMVCPECSSSLSTTPGNRSE